jgi:hypothetical protein
MNWNFKVVQNGKMTFSRWIRWNLCQRLTVQMWTGCRFRQIQVVKNPCIKNPLNAQLIRKKQTSSIVFKGSQGIARNISLWNLLPIQHKMQEWHLLLTSRKTRPLRRCLAGLNRRKVIPKTEFQSLMTSRRNLSWALGHIAVLMCIESEHFNKHAGINPSHRHSLPLFIVVWHVEILIVFHKSTNGLSF